MSWVKAGHEFESEGGWIYAQMARATYSFCRLHARQAFRVKTVSTKCLQYVAVPRFYLTVQTIDSRCKQKQKKRIMEKGERGLVTRKDGRGCLLNKTHGGSSRVFTPTPPPPHGGGGGGDTDRLIERERQREQCLLFLSFFFLFFFLTLYSLNSFRLGKPKISMQM